MRQFLLISAGLISAGLCSAGAAYAEEVIIERDAPAVVERPAGSSTTTVERHGRDCDSKTVHKENDLGESKTVTREDCD